MKKAMIFFCTITLITAALSATPISNEYFAGTWVATVEYNRSFYRQRQSGNSRQKTKTRNFPVTAVKERILWGQKRLTLLGYTT